MSGETSIGRIAYRRPAGRGLWRLALACLGGCLAAGWAAPLAAQTFTVSDVKTTLVDNVYRLDARLEYEFSPAVLDALNSGVALTLTLDIEVYQPRRYMWDEVVATLEQRYEIQYHALTEQYLLRSLNSGSQYAFPTLNAALASMGRIEQLPIIDAQLLDADERYMVRVRSRLDVDELPVPLQLKAYVSSDWWLSSGWYSWDL